MSILIKGMEMPSGLAERGFVIRGDGRVRTFNGAVIDYVTAVPVPLHGRLVDADNMEKEVCGGCVHGKHKYANCIDCALANAPTIIPADPPKETVQVNSSACEQFKYWCKSTGKACELATEFGYCKVTACTKKYDDSPKNIIIPAEE